MNYMRTSFVAFSLASLMALTTIPASADSFKRIKKAAEFNQKIVGKKLAFEHGTAVIHANGKTDGKLNKQGKYYGTWVFQKGYYCRNLVIAKKETGTDCQTVEISGNNARFTREKGKGRVTLLTIK